MFLGIQSTTAGVQSKPYEPDPSLPLANTGDMGRSH